MFIIAAARKARQGTRVPLSAGGAGRPLRFRALGVDRPCMDAERPNLIKARKPLCHKVKIPAEAGENGLIHTCG